MGVDHSLACDLTQIMVEGSGYRWGALTEQLLSLIGVLLFDVSGLLEFANFAFVPLLLSA